MKSRIIMLLMIFVILFSSCSLGEIMPSGEADYSNESVMGSAMGNTSVISELSDIIYALTIDSIRLPEFSDTSAAMSKCGDSLLNHLLTTNYSRFSGNTAVLKKAAEKYPELGITAAIGASDYEGALYKYFNHGGNIRHGDTARFRYMSKIEAYIPAVQSVANSFSLDIVSIDETPNTYRMNFYCKLGDDVSPEYHAVFIKRDRGGCYISSIKTVASEKVSYTLPEVFS